MTKSRKKGIFSLRIKVLFISIVLPTLVSSFLLVIIYSQIRSNLLTDLKQKSNTDTQLMADILTQEFSLLSNQVVSLAQNPSIKGMVNSQDNLVTNDLNRLTYDEWKSQLEEIFVAEINTKSFYDHLRYIDEFGNELVRVNLENGQAEVVSSDRLQNKADRPYFQAGLSLRPNQLYVSPIELNREGTPPQIENPYVPVIRYLYPIYDDSQNFRGLVVANILVEYVFDRLSFKQQNYDGDFLVVDKAGYYLHHPNSAKEWGGPTDLDTDQTIQADYQLIQTPIESLKSNQLEDHNFLMYVQTVSISPQDEPQIYLLRVIPKKILFRPIDQLAKVIFFSSIGGFSLATLLLILVIRRLSKPITDLVDTVDEITQTGEIKPTKHKPNQEIGVLADSFNQMSTKLRDINSLLEQKVTQKTAQLKQRMSELEVQTNVLEEKNAFIEKITQNSPAIIFIFDITQEKIIYINHDSSLLPENVKDEPNEIITNLVYPINSDEANHHLDNIKHLNDKDSIEFTQKINRADGTIISLQVSETVFKRSKSGEVNQILGIAVDISELDNAKQALSQSEQRFKLAVSGASSGVWDWNVETGEQWWSDKYYELLGYQPNEIAASIDTFSRLVHPDDKEKAFELANKHFDKKAEFEIEYRLQMKDGSYRWFLGSGQAHWDNQAKPIRMIGTITDIHKRKLYETELRRFKLAVDSATDAILFTDIEGFVVYVNTALEKLTGFSAEEIIGKKAGTLWGKLMSNEYYENLWHTVKTQKHVFKGEIENHRKDGSHFVSDLNIIPLLDDQGEIQFFVSSQRDITHAKQVDQMKTEFISLASHQLRTPLTGMRWNIEMLLDGDAGDLNDQQHKLASLVYTSSNRLVNLVNDLLDISRIESGRLELDPQPTNLKKLIDEVVAELKPLLEKKHHRCATSIHEHLPEINIDPKLIRNVLLNLISNAIKYTPNDGLIEIYASRKADMVLISVSDNGYGIPEHEQDQVFDKFYRGDNIAKTDVEGTGLGMYLVKAIIERSHGEIWFESKQNQGTTFWFTLPINNQED